MIFKTTDDGERIISFFNKAKIESENFAKQLEKDKMFLTEYFNATGDVAKQHAILNKSTNKASKNAIEYAVSTKGAAGSVSNFEQQQIKANASVQKSKKYFDLSAISANVYKLAIKGITIAANMATSALLSGVVYAFSKLFTAQNEAIEKAKELTSTYKSNNTSLEDYKEQINTLVTELNSSNISYEDSQTKRKELMSIQDELFKKYGTEEEVIKSITAAINGEVDALDTLSQKSYYEWLASVDGLTGAQKFGNGFFKIFTGISGQYKSALDSAVDYMEDKTQFFYVKTTGNEELDKLIQEKFGLYKNAFDEFVIMDIVPEEAYELLGQIRTAYRDNANEYLGTETDNILTTVNDSIQSAMTTIDTELGKHQETYHTYLEGMIKYDSEYSDEYADLLSKRELLEEAELSTNDEGKQQRVLEAKKAFYDSLNNAITSAENNDNVKRYFENLYPDLYSEISSWNFEYNISANTDGIADTAKEIGEKYTATNLLNIINTEGIQEGKESFNSLIDKAIEYGICTDKSTEEVQKLIDLLVELGIVQRQIQDAPPKAPTSFSDIFSLKSADGTITNLGKISESIDTVQNAYKTLSSAIDEYNNNGALSIDTVQSVTELGSGYLDYLMDEEGNIRLNQEALQNLTLARLQDMRAQMQQELLSQVKSIQDETDANNFAAQSYREKADGIHTVTQALLEQEVAKLTISQEEKDKVLSAAGKTLKQIDAMFDSAATGIFLDFDGGSGSGSSEFSETIDFFERRVNVLNGSLDLLKANLENVTGSFAKNNLIDAELSITEEKFKNCSDALSMYTQKADEAFAKIPADIASKVKDGAVSLNDFVGDGNQDVAEAVKAYESWAGKVSDCRQNLAELKSAIQQLELEKFNNIISDFTNRFDLRENSKDLLSKLIDLFKESGEFIGESFYTTQIDQSQKQLKLLEEEKAQLIDRMTDAVTSGRIQKGTGEWLEMVNALSDVDGSILTCKKSIEEYDNAILELHTEVFNRIQTAFGNISDEISNLIGLMEDSDVGLSDGSWTKEGLTQLGLYAQQYELAKYQVSQYAEEIRKLNTGYLDGRYSAAEYADRLADLSSAQWDAVNAAESAKGAVVDLNKVRVDIAKDTIQEQIDSYKELTDAQIKALQAEKDLHGYEKALAEKEKDIAKLRKQISAMQNDKNAATVAKRKQLEEQLADLEETQYQHSIETQEEALNQQYESYEETRNTEIEALEESLKDEERLISDSLNAVKRNTEIISGQILQVAADHGVRVSGHIVNPWKSGENAIASYGEVLSAGTSAFIGQIQSVEAQVYQLQSDADAAAATFANLFAAKADTLIKELTESYYTEENLYYMTQALQSSLTAALEGGYDVSGIVNAMHEIETAAEAAKRALDALNNTKATAGDSGGSSFNGSDGRGESGSGFSPSFYAGGSPDITEDQIAVTNEDGQEIIYRARDKSLLTRLSAGDKVFDNTSVNRLWDISHDRLPDFLSNLLPSLPQYIPYSVPPVVTSVNLPDRTITNLNRDINVHYDSLMTINGDVNDIDHLAKQMAKVADQQITKSWRKFNDEFKY